MKSSLEVGVTTTKWSLWTDSVLITAYLGCLVGLGLKHRHNIEVVHILELNTLLDTTVVFICKGLQNFDFNIRADLYCIIIHAVKHWAKFSFFADLTDSQRSRQVPLPLLELQLQAHGDQPPRSCPNRLS